MNRALALLLTGLVLLLSDGAAYAQSGSRVVETVSWVEEWDPASQQWVPVDGVVPVLAPFAFDATLTAEWPGNYTITETVRGEPTRFIARPAKASGHGADLAQFGPFRVLDDKRAALLATTDVASPQAFAAMLAAYPELEVIEFVDAPGTNNDLANLRLGRAIRAAGLATHVPDGGSARSGAVELFLAGTRRTIAPGALFAVHSWRDEMGREPTDFAADAPENRLYLDYYAEMGMSAADARAFYAMTNSVPHASALWLESADMVRWIAPGSSARRELPALTEPPLPQQKWYWALHSIAQAAPRIPSALALNPSPQVAYADLGPATLAVFDSGLLYSGSLDSGAAFP